MARPCILVVQNVLWEGPGLIDVYARASAFELTLARMYSTSGRNTSLPFEKVEKGGFTAVIGLGSPFTAYRPETNPHYKDLVELFKIVRNRKVPSFEICYSMQLFSIVHGGKVWKNPAGKEVGFFELRPTAEGRSDPVLGPIGVHTTLQWHEDVVESLPTGAVLLASSAKTKNQVAVLDGIHYLVQSDGQASRPGMVRSWLKHDADWATQRTAVEPKALIRESADREAYFRNTFFRLFGNFMAVATAIGR